MSSRKITRYGLFVSLLCVGWIGWTQAEPVVHLVSPVDDSTLNRSNVTFTVNATDAVGLTGATLYIGNSQQVATFSGPSAIIDAQIDATYPSTNFGGAVSINV